MYCTNCGTEVAEGAKFCSNCGTRLEVPAQPEVSVESAEAPVEVAAEPAVMEETAARRPSFAEFDWHVEDYPIRDSAEKTEDVDFNWNASPDDIPDVPKRRGSSAFTAEAVNAPEVKEEILRGEDLEKAVFGDLQPEKNPEEMSAAERIDKFYTFNKKNEEFQQLINNEYERVKSGNAIEHELSEADKLAQERFDSRPELSSMESFLEREGIVKPYQPKEFQSDVLQRIEAQEAEKEAKRLEEEARLAAIEEARLEAEAKRKAEEEAAAALKAEEERKAAELARLEEEARIKAEEEARLRAEEEARVKAEAEAELARLQAEAEAAELERLRAEEEARQKAEEEERLRAEAEARLRAEEEAKFRAEEEERLKAEAELRAVQEAAKIRAQQEARLAAEEEAKFKAEEERRQFEAEEAQRRLEEKRRLLDEEANQAVAQEEIRKVLEQTARMREEEAAKIRAAVAGLRSGAGLAGAAAAVESAEVIEAHKATKDQINEMAKARDAFFADMEPFEETKEAEPEKPVIEEPVIQHITGRETMLSSDEIAKTRVIDKRAIIAGLNEPTRVASVPVEPAPADDDEFFRSLENASVDPLVEELPDADELAGFEEIQEEAQPIDFKEEAEEETEAVTDLDDLLSQFESVNDLADPEETAEGNSGLEDTVLMKEEPADEFAGNDFDSYGNEEAENFRNQQEAEEAGNDESADVPVVALSRKEQKQKAKEQKRIEKEKALEAKAAKKRDKQNQIEEDDEEEETGGKGRIVLKIILVLLIIILVIEVAGMGIRFLAPNSGAAEFIDNQLNKVIHMVTGEDDSVEYTVESRADDSSQPSDAAAPSDDAQQSDAQ